MKIFINFFMYFLASLVHIQSFFINTATICFIFQKFTKPIFFDIMKLHNFLESEVRKNEFTRDK